MATGKLYKSSDNQFVANVNYKFHEDSPSSWWGELTLTDYVRVSETDGYVIELEDKRKGTCRLKKRVNRAVSGIPPRYIYHFSGASALK